MRGTVAIAAKDLKQSSRSPATYFVGVLTPFLLILLMDLLVGGVNVGGSVRVGVADQDRSAVSAQFSSLMNTLEERGVVETVELDAGTNAREAIDDQDLAGVIVLPNGFGQAVEGGGDVPALSVVEDANARSAPKAVTGIATSFTQQLDQNRALAAAGGDAAEAAEVTLDEELVGGAKLRVGTQLTVAMTSLFLLITLQFGGTGVLKERQQGTLTRLLAAPVSPWAVVAAKALAIFVTGTFATLLLIAFTSVTTSAEWGPTLGVLVLVAGLAAAATGIVMVVTGLSRTAEGVTNLLAVVALAVGMFGSGLVPLPSGGVLGTLASAVPHHWFYEGIRALAGEGTWTAALPYAGVLFGFAAVLCAAGATLLRRRLAA